MARHAFVNLCGCLKYLSGIQILPVSDTELVILVFVGFSSIQLDGKLRSNYSSSLASLLVLC